MNSRTLPTELHSQFQTMSYNLDLGIHDYNLEFKANLCHAQPPLVCMKTVTVSLYIINKSLNMTRCSRTYPGKLKGHVAWITGVEVMTGDPASKKIEANTNLITKLLPTHLWHLSNPRLTLSTPQNSPCHSFLQSLLSIRKKSVHFLLQFSLCILTSSSVEATKFAPPLVEE